MGILKYGDVKKLIGNPEYQSITLDIVNPYTGKIIADDGNNVVSLYKNDSIPEDLVLYMRLYDNYTNKPGDIRVAGQIIKQFTDEEALKLYKAKITQKQLDKLLELPLVLPSKQIEDREKLNVIEIGLDPPSDDIDEQIDRFAFLDDIIYLYISNGTEKGSIRYYFIPENTFCK